MTVNEQTHLESRLRGAWRRQRVFFGVRGLCAFAVCTGVLLAADFLLDWQARLSGGGRAALLGANAAVLLGVLYLAWWRRLRRYDARRMALEVEALHPRLRSLLVSYVQLGGAGAPDGASPELVQAMREQAVAQTAELDFGGIVRFRSLGRLFAGAALSLAVLGALMFWQPRYWSVFLLRLSNPGADIAYPTRTLLEPVTRDLVVQQGRSVVLRARLAGQVPPGGYLVLVRGKGERETVPVGASAGTATNAPELVYRLEEVSRDFRYGFRAGDAVSREHTVSVVPPPLVQPRVRVTYPDYTRRKAQELETLSFEVLEGSRLVWRLKSNQPLLEATLLPEGRDPVPMAVSADGGEATAELPAEKSFAYSLRWQDRRHKFVYASGVRYAVNVVPDAAPRVALLEPARDGKATLRQALDLAYDAKDDFGVTAARVVYRIESAGQPGGGGAAQETRVPLREFTNAVTEVRDQYRWEIQEAVPGLKEGDVLVYAVEVSDSRSPTGNVARSASRRLSVLSPQDYVREAMEKRRELLDRIRKLHAQESDAVEAVGKLGGKPGGKAPRKKGR